MQRSGWELLGVLPLLALVVAAPARATDGPYAVQTAPYQGLMESYTVEDAPGRAAHLRVVGPSGHMFEVWDMREGRKLDTPFDLEVEPGASMLVVAHMSNGTVWQKWFSVGPGKRGTIQMKNWYGTDVGAASLPKPGVDEDTPTESLTWGKSPDGKSYIRVLGPGDATVELWAGSDRARRWDSPVDLEVTGDLGYRLVVRSRDTLRWERWMKVPRGMMVNLTVKSSNLGVQVEAGKAAISFGSSPQATGSSPMAGRPPPASAQQPPPPMAAPTPPAAPPRMGAASSDDDFQSLLAAIKRQTFADDRMNVLKSAMSSRQFTVGQVGALVDIFTFSDDKVKVVRALRSHIVDPQNAHQLLSHFTHSTDKDAVQRILSGGEEDEE